MRAKKTGTDIRKEQIAEAALKLINTTGVAALSIAAIAREVGIVPSALYRHFDGKQEVLDSVLALLDQRLTDNVARAARQETGVLARLRAIMFGHARMLAEFRAVPFVIFSDTLYAGHPERKRQVHRILGTYLQRIQKLIARGQQEGIVRRDLAPEMASVLFLGMIVPAAVLSHLSDGNYDFMAHVASAWPAYERSLTCRCDAGPDNSIGEEKTKGSILP